MTIKNIQNATISLAPYNNLTQEFKEYLESHYHKEIITFFDNNPKNRDTVSYHNSSIPKSDFVIVISPNYFKEITKELLKNSFTKEQILYAIYLPKKDAYTFTSSPLLYHLRYQLILLQRKYVHYTNLAYFKIWKLKNKHTNKRAFIIGNGPSLKIDDLTKLQNEITFAANKIYLSFKSTPWRPSYYFVIDKLVYTQNYETIKNLKLKKFFSIDMIHIAPKIKNAHYFEIETKHGYPKMPSFHANPFKGVNKGNTVVYAMAEFAVYMGIKELYFIGMDFNFIVNETPTLQYTNQTLCAGEINHFHPEYRQIGEKWNKPNMQGLHNSFEKIKSYCKEHNIKVYNATRGGKLEILERVDFDKLFEENKAQTGR
ncbi:MAG: 6-hydroxymethylpterin diphosphokinase MptE-like protein [Sulfurimonadaceae bacterium]